MSEDERPSGNSQYIRDRESGCVAGDGSVFCADKRVSLDHLNQANLRMDRRKLLKLAGSAVISLFSGCAQLETGGNAQNQGGTITVTPPDGLIDDPLEIRLSDFEPNEEISVRAHTTDNHGQTWLSFGQFKTDGDGTLSLTQQAPISGTYERVDPRGLLWSMQALDGPAISFTTDELYTVHVSVQRNGTTVASTRITRRFIATDVGEHPVDEDGLVGVFFEPPGSGPHPAILTLHGTEGQVPWLLGAMLASHGYATLALQYFDPIGKTELPTSLVEIPLEYFERAIDWVLDRPSVTGDRVGVVGPSIGGELTLLLGATLSRIGVIVGYVPSSLVWEGPGGERPMWTYNGKDIPFVPIEVNQESVPSLIGAAAAGIRGRPIRVADLFRPSFDDLGAESVKAGIIPVDEIDGPVLLISGKDDGIWPSTALSEIAIHRLDSHDHPYAYEHLAYENAGHIISVPAQPTTDWDTFNVMPGMTLDAGGTASGNAHAAADSWPRVLEFLAEGLR
ncbi:acyl-CoA thioester hydrolase/BAAT C-terminal domain-containing protein [Halegenticoccus tardaugens]|uniref:acyl-CoA thioester hydrolase/BAAT C-terminal domain-containing protein n=1 Tax=Halegenticoccus tardaugens TaxID=2071624 RepID=UPI0013E9046E|nr:acyl-CoA thioesterase/bile acid-CoA:amino acid N-acyltransferase family protein [Halegenticoccus tardaugens]